MGARITIEQMHALAKAHDGFCLSTVYVNSKAKLRWRCPKGHEWEATPDNVKNNGRWCPCCSETSNGQTKKRPWATGSESMAECPNCKQEGQADVDICPHCGQTGPGAKRPCCLDL